MRHINLIAAIGVGLVLVALPATAARSTDPSTPLQLAPGGIQEAQTSQPPQSGAMGPYEQRVQELLRRLDLPPDPKLKQKVDQAFATRNACFENAMRPLVRKGLRGNDLAEAACKACVKQVIDAAAIFFEANKHRYLEPNPEKKIEEDQDNCSLFAFSIALEMPDRMAEEPDQTAVIARYGDWVVTEELNFERRMLIAPHCKIAMIKAGT